MEPASPPTDVLDYVRSAARLLELPLEPAQAERVALHLARTRDLAATLRGFAMADDLEPAEVFCPAPFPPEDAP